LGQQRLYIIRGWVSDPSNRIFRPSMFHFIRVQFAVLRISILGFQCSPLKIPEPWWQYTSSDAVCQIRR
jgi:hypothetical protein